MAELEALAARVERLAGLVTALADALVNQAQFAAAELDSLPDDEDNRLRRLFAQRELDPWVHAETTLTKLHASHDEPPAAWKDGYHALIDQFRTALGAHVVSSTGQQSPAHPANDPDA